MQNVLKNTPLSLERITASIYQSYATGTTV